MLFDIHASFIPECYLDTNLVEFLLEKPNSVNHKKGNSSVAATMNEKRFLDRFAVGIIDDDKRRLKRLDECLAIERLWGKGLKMFKHKSRQHYFIQISPAIETWIINQCAKGKIDLSIYQLPAILSDLKKMKGLTQRNDERFKKLFADMLVNENCDGINELKRWLHFLKENNYSTNIDLL